MISARTALVTGCSRRIGASIAQCLHDAHYSIAIHYRHSKSEALELCAKFNRKRPDSAKAFHADLEDTEAAIHLAEEALSGFGRIDTLVNNASVYEQVPMESLDAGKFEEFFRVHMLAPYLLTMSLAPHLSKHNGCVVNITDVYSARPAVENALYSATKAGLESLTKSLALQLAPKVRVNAVAPGAILMPENFSDNNNLLERTPLVRWGTPQEIAKTVKYLVCDATYTTGQVLTVDGGRSVNTV